MNRLLIFIGIILGGYLGWWAAEYIDLGLMATFLVSSVGSAAGVYAAWRVGRDYLS